MILTRFLCVQCQSSSTMIVSHHCQTGKTTTIRRAAVRGIRVSLEPWGINWEEPLNSLGPSQHYGIEGFEVELLIGPPLCRRTDDESFSSPHYGKLSLENDLFKIVFAILVYLHNSIDYFDNSLQYPHSEKQISISFQIE